MERITMEDGEAVRNDIAAAISMAAGSEAAGAEEYSCAVCEDRGIVICAAAEESADADSPKAKPWKREARQCECVRQRGAKQRLDRAAVPRRFQNASLSTLRTGGLDPSIGFAVRMARAAIATWPACKEPRSGLLLCGTCGVGKTHLAAGLLRELVTTRGASGRFWDVGDLLLQLKRSFSGKGDVAASGAGDARARSEGSVIEELTEVDVLVLDELGAQRVTEWSYDELGVILGARYNADRLTVVTTNYPNLAPGAAVPGAPRGTETLGDRIGARVWSRLQEMCRPVEMVGADFRVRKSA